VKTVTKIAVLGLLALLGWLVYDFVFDRAPPHRFVVTVDREIRSAQLTLNGESKAMDVSGKTATGSMRFSDASGKIVIAFVDGTRTECVIGYITNGELEPHEIQAVNGNCVVPPVAI
jgi:hypothetical protein